MYGVSCLYLHFIKHYFSLLYLCWNIPRLVQQCSLFPVPLIKWNCLVSLVQSSKSRHKIWHDNTMAFLKYLGNMCVVFLITLSIATESCGSALLFSSSSCNVGRGFFSRCMNCLLYLLEGWQVFQCSDVTLCVCVLNGNQTLCEYCYPHTFWKMKLWLLFYFPQITM